MDQSNTSLDVLYVSHDRKVKMNNLWEYSSTRRSLLSKRIYLLASACLGDCTEAPCRAGGGLNQRPRAHPGNVFISLPLHLITPRFIEHTF